MAAWSLERTPLRAGSVAMILVFAAAIFQIDSRAAPLPPDRSVLVKKVWVEHGAEQDGQPGMTLHAEVVYGGLKGTSSITAFDFHTCGGEPIGAVRGTADRYVAKDGQVSIDFRSENAYDSTKWNYSTFCPYGVLDLGRDRTGRALLTCQTSCCGLFSKGGAVVNVRPGLPELENAPQIRILDVQTRMSGSGTPEARTVVEGHVQVFGLKGKQVFVGIWLKLPDNSPLKPVASAPEAFHGFYGRFTRHESGPVEFDATEWNPFRIEIPHNLIDLSRVPDQRAVLTLYATCAELMTSVVRDITLGEEKAPVAKAPVAKTPPPAEPEKKPATEPTGGPPPGGPEISAGPWDTEPDRDLKKRLAAGKITLDQAFLEAVESGRTRMVSELLDAGADPDSIGADGRGALEMAIDAEQPETAVLLADRGAVSDSEAMAPIREQAVAAAARRVARAKSFQSYMAPDQAQVEMLEILRNFDVRYKHWSLGSVGDHPELWEKTADELRAVVTGKDCAGGAGGNAPFVLRCMLAEGESRLFAAAGHWASGKKERAVELYTRGIGILSRVLREAACDAGIDRLPNYSSRGFFVNHQLNPWAGYESIASEFEVILQAVDRKELNARSDTPLPGSAPLKLRLRRETGSVHGVPSYVGVEEINFKVREWLIRYGLLGREGNLSDDGKSWVSVATRQTATSEMAARFLSDFCPWGVDLYMLLREAGLLDNPKQPCRGTGLDYAILRPFSSEHSVLKSLGSLVTGYKGPPLVSELVVRDARIPMHVADEMMLIIGDGTQGFLDPLKQRAIEWNWVAGKPTFTIRYISPRVYDPTIAELFSQAMEGVKLLFGGPADWAVDKSLGALLDCVGNYYGKNGQVYSTSWLLVHGNDKGILTTNAYEKGEGPSRLLVLKKLSGAMFGVLDEHIRKGLFESISPRLFSLGTTYDGSPIPPILLRGDVLGFEKVRESEYERNVQPVRFYQLLPNFLVRKKFRPYALEEAGNRVLSRRGEYLKEQSRYPGARSDDGGMLIGRGRPVERMEDVRKWAWKEVQPPHGYHDYVTDFTPWKQELRISLPDELRSGMKDDEPLRFRLFSGEPGSSEKYIDCETKERLVTLFIFDPRNPKTAQVESEGLKRFRSRSEGTVELYRKWCSFRSFRRKPLCAYRLEVLKKGSLLTENPLVLSKGRRNRLKITGRLHSPEPGVVVLDTSARPDPSSGWLFSLSHKHQVQREWRTDTWHPARFTPGDRLPFAAAPRILAVQKRHLDQRRTRFEEQKAAGRQSGAFVVFDSHYFYPEQYLLRLECAGQVRYVYRIPEDGLSWGSDLFYGLKNGEHLVHVTLYATEGFEKEFRFTFDLQRPSLSESGARGLEKYRRNVAKWRKQLETLPAGADRDFAWVNLRKTLQLYAVFLGATGAPADQVVDLLSEAFTTDVLMSPVPDAGSFTFCRESVEYLRRVGTKNALHLAKLMLQRCTDFLDRDSTEGKEVALLLMHEFVADIAVSIGDIEGARNILEKRRGLVERWDGREGPGSRCSLEFWPVDSR